MILCDKPDCGKPATYFCRSRSFGFLVAGNVYVDYGKEAQLPAWHVVYYARCQDHEPRIRNQVPVSEEEYLVGLVMES